MKILEKGEIRLPKQSADVSSRSRAPINLLHSHQGS